MILKSKHTKILVAFMAVMVGALALVSTASAECGPGFTNKKQLIHYYQTNPDAAHGFRKWLLDNADYTGYQADETVVNWLRSPEQKVFNAPSGYVLKTNTYCPGGPGDYSPYHGLLDNMGGKPMLWHCDKEGDNCVPILKGYCMNAVTGKPCHKHHKKKHHKCGCRKKKHHKHHKKSCEAKGLVTGPAGSCVEQTNTANAQQECEAKDNHQWTGNQCVIIQIQINSNCSNVAVGNEGSVNQGGGNCQTGGSQECVGQSNCNTENPPPPCPCTPPPPAEEKAWVELMKVQEVDVGKSSLICASVHNGHEVTFHAEYGHFKHEVKSEPQYGPEAVCDTYTAPTEVLTDCYWVTFKNAKGEILSSKDNKEPEEQKKCFQVQNPEEEHGGWH